MNETSNKRPVIVGLFVFLGVLFLVGGILMVGNLHETFKKKMTVVSLFDDVSGLQAGNNVWFSGVKIGTVTNLHFYGNSQVEVSMKIEKSAREYIRKNAMVKISTDGLIGNKILIIYGGTAKAEAIAEGDTLGVEKTFTSEDMIITLQENNKNLLSITSDFKLVSRKLASGEGTVGRLLNDTSVYAHLNSATRSLENASLKANQVLSNLSLFSAGLMNPGTLAHDLVTDSTVFRSLTSSVLQLQQIADTANSLVNTLNAAGKNPRSAVGVLLHDEEAGKQLKETFRNLESGSKKLDEDLEAARHNFLLRGYFKKKAKAESKEPPQN